jgi:hypothetical protein
LLSSAAIADDLINWPLRRTTMNKLMIVLALLMGAVFFGAVTANAQG